MATTEAPPINIDEWGDLCERIETLWPGTRVWDNADTFFHDGGFDLYDAVTLGRAVTALFDEGRQAAPSPSKVKEHAKRIAGERGINIAERGPHQHALGEMSPFYLYGGVFAAEKGPGEVTCEIAGCDYRRDCHCKPCVSDPLYAETRRMMTDDEIETQRLRREAAGARYRRTA